MKLTKQEQVVNELAKISILLKLQESANNSKNKDILAFVSKFVEDNK